MNKPERLDLATPSSTIPVDPLGRNSWPQPLQRARVFPVPPGSKEPFEGFKWKEQASSDPDQIERWHTQYPDCDWAMAAPEGIVIVDLDIRDDRDGFISIASVEGYQAADLQTFGTNTPSRGKQLYFLTDQVFKQKPLASGIDIKPGGKGYVKIPPSAGYAFDTAHPIRPLPAWIKPEPQTGKDASLFVPRNTTSAPSSASPTNHGELAALHNLLKRIDPDLPYSEWIDVIFAVLNAFGESGEVVEELSKWSEAGKKYEASAFEKAVTSYDSTKIEKLGLPVLNRIAARHPRFTGTLPSVPPSDAAAADDLAERTLKKAIEILQSHGNTPSRKHEDGLRALCKGLAYGVYCSDKFRLAFPLETGMGKSTCIAALVWALKDTDTALLICAERVDQLDDLQTQLLSLGVPGWKIAIFHASANHKHINSVKPANLDQTQFLLLAHNRVKSAGKAISADEMLRYKGRKRDLVVWDESMITAAGHHLDRGEVIDVCAAWRARYDDKLRTGPLTASLSEQDRYEDLYRVLGEIHGELSRVGTDGEIEIIPPKYDPEDCAPMIATLATTKQGQAKTTLQALVRFAQIGKARVVRGAGQPAVVQYEQTIDDAFDQMVILDASAPIRDLVRYDRSVEIYPLKLSKDYSAVNIKAGRAKASKSSFKDSDWLEAYLDQAEEILRNEIPADEPVLVFTHQKLEADVETGLKARGFSKVKVLHWGQHRASNRYANYKYTITIGVLYRDAQELAATILGQARDLGHPLMLNQVISARTSEIAELVYQGLSRGQSRMTIGGKAGEQTNYLFLPARDLEPVLDLLNVAMPSVRVQPYIPKMLIAGDAALLADEVMRYLSNQPSTTTTVSTNSIRRNLGFTGNSNDRVWRKAEKIAATDVVGWVKRGQTFERVPPATSQPGQSSVPRNKTA